MAIRNQISSDEETNQSVKMQHYKELLKVDEKQGVLRVGRKLSDQHVKPSPFEKMNVHLAIEVDKVAYSH
jgi:hypothetical protein